MLLLPLVAAAALPTPDTVRGVPDPVAHRLALLHPTRGPAAPPSADGSAWDVTHYTFRVRIDPDARAFDATATIEATALEAGGPLYLDADGPVVSALRMDGADAEPTVTDGVLTLRPQGDTTTIEAAWTAEGDTVGGLQWGDVVFAFNEPTRARTWLLCHDVPDDKATVRWEITVPEGLVVAANGVLEGTETADGWTTWIFDLDVPIATYLMVLHVADYVRIELDGPVPVEAWVYPGTEDAAAETFATTGEMLDFFGERYGPYAFPSYGNVVAPFGGAMENPTVVTFSDELVGDPWGEMVNVHELGHHWFGDDVTLADWEHIWLNEGFATYTEALWYERAYGDDGLSGYVAYLRSTYVDWQEIEGVGTLVDPAYLWGGTVYDKGALVVHMLRGVLGDDVFFEALRTYVARHHLGNADSADLQAVVEEVAGEDLAWFFDPWLHAAGDPTYTWGWAAQRVGDGWQLDVTVAQDRPEFTMPVPVDVRLADGTVTHESVWVEGEGGALALCVDQEPVEVALDPDGWVLRAGEESVEGVAGPVVCGEPAAVEEAPGGCGCGAPSAPGAAAALAALLAWRRKRA